MAPKTKTHVALTSGTWASELNLFWYYVRCSLKPEMDVSRHIQQSHGQQIVWQEKFMLSLKYAIQGSVSTELRATLSMVRICFLDAWRHESDTGGFSCSPLIQGTSTPP